MRGESTVWIELTLRSRIYCVDRSCSYASDSNGACRVLLPEYVDDIWYMN